MVRLLGAFFASYGLFLHLTFIFILLHRGKAFSSHAGLCDVDDKTMRNTMGIPSQEGSGGFMLNISNRSPVIDEIVTLTIHHKTISKFKGLLFVATDGKTGSGTFVEFTLPDGLGLLKRASGRTCSGSMGSRITHRNANEKDLPLSLQWQATKAGVYQFEFFIVLARTNWFGQKSGHELEVSQPTPSRGKTISAPTSTLTPTVMNSSSFLPAVIGSAELETDKASNTLIMFLVGAVLIISTDL